MLEADNNAEIQDDTKETIDSGVLVDASTSINGGEYSDTLNTDEPVTPNDKGDDTVNDDAKKDAKLNATSVSKNSDDSADKAKIQPV
ncbi:MAG: hypothetical protein L0G25_03790 [Psychrobacter sp.]|nr:hypothetical protein [Psychrobacter sp.]